MENWRAFLKNSNLQLQEKCDPALGTCRDPDNPEEELLYSDTEEEKEEEKPNRSPSAQEFYKDATYPEGYNQDFFFRYNDYLQLHGPENDPFLKNKGKGKYPIFPKKQTADNKWPDDMWIVRYGLLQGFDDDWENAPAICTRDTGIKFIEMIKILNEEPMVDSINLVYNKHSHARPSFDEWGSGTERSRRNKGKGKEFKGANQHKAGKAFDILIPEDKRGIVAEKMKWLEKVVEAAQKVGFTRFGFGLNNIHVDTKDATPADFMWVYHSPIIYSGDLLNATLKPFNKEPTTKDGKPTKHYEYFKKRDENYAIVKKYDRFLNWIPYLSDGLRRVVKSKWQKRTFDKARRAQAKKYKLK